METTFILSVVYLMALSVTQTIKHQMTDNEKLIKKDAEAHTGLIYSTISAFTWSNWINYE
jgi:hypothetical protein